MFCNHLERPGLRPLGTMKIDYAGEQLQELNSNTVQVSGVTGVNAGVSNVASI